MTKTPIVLALLTVGVALPTVVDHVPPAEALIDAATNWLSSLVTVARCPSVPDLGGCP